MILEVKFWPHPSLRDKAQLVKKENLKAASDLVDALFETMYAWRGMGLAATQTQVPLSVLVIDTEQVNGTGTLKRAFINPVIIGQSENTVTTEEGCLSFPGVFAKVERPNSITIESMTLTGEQETVILNGVDAVCIQHEIDHLNGIVFFDHLKPAKRRMVEAKVRKNVKKLKKKINRKRK